MSKLTISTPEQLLKVARNFKFGQRQDSLSSQVSDLIPVFKTLKMDSLVKDLTQHGLDQDSSFSQKSYSMELEKFQLAAEFSVNTPQAAFAQRLAVFFGCYDAADYLKHVDV